MPGISYLCSQFFCLSFIPRSYFKRFVPFVELKSRLLMRKSGRVRFIYTTVILALSRSHNLKKTHTACMLTVPHYGD